jgi:hypothetical protein
MGGYYNPYASGFSAAHMAAAAAAAAAQQSGQVRIYTLQRNSDFCIPRKGTERPQSQFHCHVSVSDLFIPTIGPHIFLQQNRQTDRGTV